MDRHSNFRPSEEKIRSRWSEFMSDPLLSISQIRQNGFEGKIDCLRSLYWRIFLGQLPLLSPNNQASDELLSWTIALEQCRLNWEIFRKKFFRGPDGKFVDGCSSSNQKLSIHKSFTINRLNLNRTDTSPLLDLVVNNPLSQHEANPWNVWLDDLEMRKVIQQDVVRTFPDIAYFHQPHIQALLTNVLHAYCKVNKDLGYRQGMHEILAVLVRTLDQDSLLSPKDQPPDLMHQVLSREFLEHDSYSLFCLLMNSIKPWYHSHSNIKLPRLSSNFSSDFPSSALGFIPIQISNSLSHSESLKSSETILVPQIVEKCFEIFEIYLRQIDFELWDHLSRLEIEPQLWGIRWIRLLFTREFNYDESLKIWDAILAEDSSRLRLVDFFCLAMLLRIRDELLSSDSNQCLHLLLKYPRTNNDGDHRVEVLVYQALLLSRFPSPATASLIHLQNLDLQASASSASETNYKIDFSDRALANKVSRNSISLEGDFAKGKEINSQRSTSLPSEHRFSIGALGRSFYSNPENLGRDGGSLNSAFWQRKNNLLIAENVSQKNSHLVQATPSKGKDHGQVLELKSEEREEELLKELKSLHQFNQDIGEVVGLCVEALQRKISRSTGPVETSEGLSLGVLKHLQQVIKTDACSGIDPCVLRPLKDHLTSIATPIFQSKPHLDGSSDQNLPPKSRIIKSQSTEFLCGQSLPKPSFDLTQSEILGKSKRPGSDRTGGCTNSEKMPFKVEKRNENGSSDGNFDHGRTIIRKEEIIFRLNSSNKKSTEDRLGRSTPIFDRIMNELRTPNHHLPILSSDKDKSNCRSDSWRELKTYSNLGITIEQSDGRPKSIYRNDEDEDEELKITEKKDYDIDGEKVEGDGVNFYKCFEEFERCEGSNSTNKDRVKGEQDLMDKRADLSVIEKENQKSDPYEGKKNIYEFINNPDYKNNSNINNVKNNDFLSSNERKRGVSNFRFNCDVTNDPLGVVSLRKHQ